MSVIESSMHQMPMQERPGIRTNGPVNTPALHQASLGFIQPSDDILYPHVMSVEKGFAILGFAATFMAGVQAQVMSISINTSRAEQTTWICIINALFVSGLVLDLVASFLAFLTARWLQRLSEAERKELEKTLRKRISPPAEDLAEEQSRLLEEGQRSDDSREEERLVDRIIHFWCSLSLFVPMPLLVIGVLCMGVGVEIYVWTFHKPLVGILVSLAYLALIPFIIGVFAIGSTDKRRKGVIHGLGKRQGDW